jgi:hypothetical protein
MMDTQLNGYDDIVRRLAAAIRGATLYSPTHPLVQRGVDSLAGLCASLNQKTENIVIGFIGDDVVVNAARLPKSAAALVGFARNMREREIEKITIQRGVTRNELRTFIFSRRTAIGDPPPRGLQQKGRGANRDRPPGARTGRRDPGTGIAAGESLRNGGGSRNSSGAGEGGRQA